jgi:O-antigen/teichoic acid export membrane protein
LKDIITLIKGFQKRAGNWIFIATIIARVSNFIVHLIVLYLIPKEQLGIIIYAYSFIGFLIPISGLGIQQSLARYGALLKYKDEKNTLFKYVFKKGLILNLVFILFLIPFAYLYPFKFSSTKYYFLLLSFSLVSHFLLLLIKIYFRLFYKNKIYAQLEIVYSFMFLILTSVLAYIFKDIGYIFAIIFSPLIVFGYFFYRYIKLNWDSIYKPKLVNLGFWKFGFFAGLSYVATTFLFEIDKILIGDLMQNPANVTIYGYVSLIPMSLLFLPRVLMTADLVFITENIFNKKYVFKYIKTYITLFSIISLFILLFGSILSEYILEFLFGEEFIAHKSTFVILIIGVSGILILRGLFGNLLSAIGRANINFIIVLIAIVINIFSNKYFIPKYGILGASITSAILMWFTGLLSCILFYIYYSKILKEKTTFTP